MRCICIKKSDGKRCTFNAKPNSNFCGTHKNCNTVEAAQAPEVPKPPKAPKLPRGQVGVRTDQWGKRKPKTVSERRALKSRCGDKCYLSPHDLKYPVCAVDSNCSYDCDGIRAARNITYLINNRKNVSDEAKTRALSARSKAERLGLEHCGWELKGFKPLSL